MGQTLKFGNGTWATKKGSTLAYNDEDENYKPLPFTYTGAGKGTRVNKQGLIEVVENDRPRIDYKDSEDGVLLLENSSTNLVTYSEDFSNAAWVKLGAGTGSTAIVTSDYAISPDGTQNASRLQCDLNGGLTSSGNQSLIYDAISGSGDTSGFIYVKSNTNSSQTFYLANSLNDYVNGVATTDWQRIEINWNAGGNGRTFAIGTRGTSNSDDSLDLLIWGAQVESGNATSYIPTQGSIQTRVAETASGSGNSEVFNSEQGILYVEGSLINDDGTSNNITLGDNTFSTNRMMLLFSNQLTNRITARFDSAGSDVTLNADGYDLTLNHKVVLKYKANDIAIWVDGFEVDSGNSFSAPTLLNRIDFYNPYDFGQDNFYGKIKELAYYDEILTDLELETLTSYRTWEAMVKELNLNVIYNG